MTRQKKLVAAAIALPIAVAAGVGLKVRRASSDTLGADVCEKDLAAVFEVCEAGGEICQKPPEGQEEACQAGCVMARCPKQVACTELDPIWCKPCEDEKGALFWRTWRGGAPCSSGRSGICRPSAGNELRSTSAAQFPPCPPAPCGSLLKSPLAALPTMMTVPSPGLEPQPFEPGGSRQMTLGATSILSQSLMIPRALARSIHASSLASELRRSMICASSSPSKRF
jgi:hypothetical protein